jgi:hypothetical protein
MHRRDGRGDRDSTNPRLFSKNLEGVFQKNCASLDVVSGASIVRLTLVPTPALRLMRRQAAAGLLGSKRTQSRLF